MVATDVFGGVACIMAFFSAAGACFFLSRGTSKARNTYHAYSSEFGKKGFEAFILRKGVPVLNPLSRLLLKDRKVFTFFEGLESLLGSHGYNTTLTNVVSICSAGVGVLFVVGSLLGMTPMFGVIFSLGGIIAGVSWLSHYKEKRSNAIREEVPDALRSMGVCSQVGYSLQQTFLQVGSEVADPLGALFLRAAHDLEAGRTADEALVGFRAQVGISELSFVAVALDVQHKAGGSLRRVLDAARDSVESELELKRTLRVQTAQAKLSARIVSLMPFVLIALFSFLSPGFLDPFFRSIEGFSLLGLAIGMQVIGILSVRKLLDVAVD